MKKILIVIGTRPEAIKMAPLYKEFLKYPRKFCTKLCVTAQHREMLDQVLTFFELIPDYDMDLMRSNQNLFTLTADIITGMKPVLEEVKPDYVFVHGDTTTSAAAALASFYYGAKVCHIEAGLRTYDKQSPWPEELNRQLTSRIADYHFAPTNKAKTNLLSEQIKEKTIEVTGNTVIDALFYTINHVNHLKDDNEIEEIKQLINLKTNIQSKEFNNQSIDKQESNARKEIILVTGHRRENHGKGFENICNALKEISEKANVHIVYPVHLNPIVQKTVYEILNNNPNISLIAPLNYEAFIWLMDKAKLIITDSGGVQEEAPSLGKPVLVMRNTTERPEAVEAGTVILVGTDTEKIVSETVSLLNDNSRYHQMSQLHNPYGDGYASSRIVNYIANLESTPRSGFLKLVFKQS
jgi:UDP-N-acetylglucosamine 2-epimerase (non-hydrolysing)